MIDQRGSLQLCKKMLQGMIPPELIDQEFLHIMFTESSFCGLNSNITCPDLPRFRNSASSEGSPWTAA
jgi:hypothetical protein